MNKKFIAVKPFNNKVFYQNAVFDNPSTRSCYLYAARKLLSKKHIYLNTIDIAKKYPIERYIYIDVPYPWDIKMWFNILRNRQKSILFIVEPPIVNPFNHMKIFHLLFSKIYTQNNKLVDNIIYFKFLLPKTTKGIQTKKIPFKNKKLLILMNSNLAPFLPFKLLSLPTKELYTQRIKAIDFFDSNYPQDFDLYGRGWNKPQKFSIKQKLFGCKKYKTYKGTFPQKDKYKILSHYKFGLCFENCQTPGYISEKIIDCFKGGSVPVYSGAPDITDYISSKCFIDYRKFKSLEELAQFLNNMDEETYNSYTAEIEQFLNRKFLNTWSVEKFARLFLKAVTK